MKFTVSTRILEHLGSDLITNNLVALVELIKNAYDAKADSVQLHFISDIKNIEVENLSYPTDDHMIYALNQYSKKTEMFILEDDGDGMSLDEIQEGFLTIGTDIKKRSKEKINSSDDRIPLGEKGIGRLSAQRLSKILFVETASVTDDCATVVLINWDNIMQMKYFEEIELPEFQVKKGREAYTRLWFVDLNFEFSEFLINEKDKIVLKEDFETTLSFLMSPYDENDSIDEVLLEGIDTIKDVPKDFEILIRLDREKVRVPTNNELLKFAEGIYQFSLKKDDGKISLDVSLNWRPWFLERVHYRLVGRELYKDYKQDHIFYKELLLKYVDRFNKTLNFQVGKDGLKKLFGNDLECLLEICPLQGKVFLFKRDATFASIAIESANYKNVTTKRNFTVKNIRSFLENKNGIKLFRGKMRIATVGDKDSDWLQFQQYSTKGQQFFRMDLGNVVGYVKVNDPFQNHIREISSRLDIRVNSHSIVLKKFLNMMFHEYFYEMSRSSSHIAKDIFEQERLLPEDPMKDMKEEVENTIKAIEESKNNFQELEGLIHIMSSASMNEEAINNNFGDTIQALTITSNAFKNKLDNTLRLVSNSKNMLKQIDNRKKMVELESYNNYKLMANGLITEVITHEMHSILSNLGDGDNYEQYFKNIEEFILKTHKDINLYSKSVRPIHKRFKFTNTRMNEMSDLYGFLEKTFIYKGTSEDLVNEDLHSFISNLEKRFSKRLQDNNVTLEYSNIDSFLRVPKGTLVHVFYNLIDNALYWIKIRRELSKTNKFYERNSPDIIYIQQANPNLILFSDTGTGVLERMENTLFHPLESGKERNGRGLGLYIIRKLLGSFGADIDLLHERNEYNRRFVFSLNFDAVHDENTNKGVN